ncbi:uncharacterized protein LOC131950434 [Physella acuta]|uniref:uncharacterized protein LOC131950434 n=1 Tax=Physella acuta TaxID=109671 RepID=UPI0027DDFCA4|nr:uncharacterized protein LOC131950434 [Physella acuta]
MTTASATTTALAAASVITAPLASARAQPAVILSKEFKHIFALVVFIIGVLLVSVFGIFFNSLNLLVYFKQGFKDTVNISFFAISLADLMSLIPLVWSIAFSTCRYLPWYIPVENSQVNFVVTVFPSQIFSRISRWIKVLINLERCACIIQPLKVKRYFTARVTTVVIVTIYLSYVIEIPLFYVCTDVRNVFYEPLNMTILSIFYISNCYHSNNDALVIHTGSIICPCFLDIVCTIIISHHLQVLSKKRKKFLNVRKNDTSETKDVRLIKMLIIINVIFIFTAMPIAFVYASVFFERLFYYEGWLGTVYYIISESSVFLDEVGVSVNIFIYYNMSAKFKATYLKLFHPKKQ